VSRHDAIIVGAGPAGSTCAALLAARGWRVLLLEKSRFPRHKVCGDCLNPSIWPIIDRLELRDRLRALPHAPIRKVAYSGVTGASLAFPIPPSANGAIAVKRSDFDALLAARALECGADFRDGAAVTAIRPAWTVETTAGVFSAPVLLAADGRNSTVARALNRLGRTRRERVAIQCHCPCPADTDDAVRLFFHHGGYGGTAGVGGGEMNLCLVAGADGVDALRAFAAAEFGVDETTRWHTIAPLSRDDARTIAADGCFLLGDAARIVEPFTGEGIYYAMRSGELAADALLANPPAAAERAYRRAHAGMYRGRLWINRLAKLAALNPAITSSALRIFRHCPAPIGILTRSVVCRDAAAL